MFEKHTHITVDKSVSSGAWEMLKMHAHNVHELYFLVSGQRRYFIEDTLYDVEAGDLMIIPKTKLHRTLTKGNGAHTRYVVYFDDQMVDALVRRIGAENYEKLLKFRKLQLPPEIFRQIRAGLEQMWAEKQAPDELSHVADTYILENILLLTLRHGVPKSPVVEKNVSKMQEVAHYIHKNLASHISLKDAANMAHMEATYFSKAFKAATGEGFQEYLTKMRLQKAEQLLAHSDLPVSKVAEACGFSAANYFSDVFRHWKGLSPTQYRKYLQNHNF